MEQTSPTLSVTPVQRNTLGRRKLPRRRLGRLVGVLHQGNYFIAESVEIGEGGMGFRCNFELEEKSRVVLSLQLPGSEFIFLTGELLAPIKGKSPNGAIYYALQFIDIHFEQRRLIRNFVTGRKD